MSHLVFGRTPFSGSSRAAASQSVHGADEIGLDALGDDDIAVKLRLEKPGGAKRKRPDADASTSQQRQRFHCVLLGL